MNHSPAFDAMQPCMPMQRVRVEELKNEAGISTLALRSFFASLSLSKLSPRPQLPLVFAEILDNERANAFNAQQPLACSLMRGIPFFV
jgi:hypothetical protein